jgi:hypothetical protein
MKTMNLVFSRRLVGLAAACCLVIAARAAVAAEPGDGGNPTWRDLFVKQLAEDNKQGLAAELQLTKPIKHSAAFEYRVLLSRGEGHPLEPIDARTHQFQLGDCIRLEIQPVKDSYIHILNKGPSRQVKCLWPMPGEQPPLVRAGEKVELPSEALFCFGEPTGREEVIIVAALEPISELLRLRDAEVEPEVYTAGLAKLDEIRGLPKLAWRGLAAEDWNEFHGLVERIKKEQPGRVTGETPPDEKTGKILAWEVTTEEAPNLYVNIPLESK